MLQTLVQLISAVAWPVTTLSIVWLLRREVGAAFGRIERAKLPGGAELSFGKTEADKPTERKQARADAVRLGQGDWIKTANVYWLGHDMMWTIDVLLRGAPRETILHGLTQSVHHLGELGFAESSYGSRLRRLRERASESLESDWDSALREQFALDLRRLADQLGAIAEMQQPTFAPGPMYERSDA